MTNKTYIESFLQESLENLRKLVRHQPLSISCALIYRLYCWSNRYRRGNIDDEFIEFNLLNSPEEDIKFLKYLGRNITPNNRPALSEDVCRERWSGVKGNINTKIRIHVPLQYIKDNESKDLRWWFSWEPFWGWSVHFIYLVYEKTTIINDEKSIQGGGYMKYDCYLRKMFGPPGNGSLQVYLIRFFNQNPNELEAMVSTGVDIDDIEPGAI